MTAFAACEELVRRHDPDRFLSALFAPAEKRRFLYGLYAFNYEMAHISEAVHEPMIGEIRLAWWRETVEGARAGMPRNHDVAKALAETFAANDLPEELFEKMIEARSFDVSTDSFADIDALEAYADATSGSLMRLAALVLGVEADDLAREAGIAYALTGMLRAIPLHAAHSKHFVADDLVAALTQRAQLHLDAARRIAMPKQALAAFLPAALVPLYLKRPQAPQWLRQIAFLRAAIRGHL
ncbi:MAG: squalene/phytoene synthase family protein [Alphaproteobacteria bacterium]|nr:squalene/phytoene synthase family protein [Alphaproteobacteria bacterium]MDE2110341.1 squalene/phytoene synthase family protein [Alphaproteobacteria bacterium]MDE2494880.1 squalene/phytoene synthase family protein [Alphaproteobacteria bacterium]